MHLSTLLSTLALSLLTCQTLGAPLPITNSTTTQLSKVNNRAPSPNNPNAPHKRDDAVLDAMKNMTDKYAGALKEDIGDAVKRDAGAGSAAGSGDAAGAGDAAGSGDAAEDATGSGDAAGAGNAAGSGNGAGSGGL